MLCGNFKIYSSCFCFCFSFSSLFGARISPGFTSVVAHRELYRTQLRSDFVARTARYPDVLLEPQPRGARQLAASRKQSKVECPYF